MRKEGSRLKRLWEEHKPLDMLKKTMLRPDDGAEKAENPETAENPEEAAEQKETVSELDKAKAQAEEYLNMAQRVQADFDNFRRRNASVRADAYEDGAKDTVKLILPVVDNLERALEAKSEDQNFRAGVELTYRQLMDILKKRGVEEISRLGEKFDPSLENAVMRSPKESGEPGTVSQVFQKGYKLGDTVLRFAMVQVVED